MYMPACILVHVCMQICWYICGHAYKSLCMHMYVWHVYMADIYMYVDLCVCVSILCACFLMSMCLCICMSEYMYMNICAFVFMFKIAE